MSVLKIGGCCEHTLAAVRRGRKRWLVAAAPLVNTAQYQDTRGQAKTSLTNMATSESRYLPFFGILARNTDRGIRVLTKRATTRRASSAAVLGVLDNTRDFFLWFGTLISLMFPACLIRIPILRLGADKTVRNIYPEQLHDTPRSHLPRSPNRNNAASEWNVSPC